MKPETGSARPVGSRLLLAAAVALSAGAPPAAAQDASLCIPIHAEIRSTFFAAGCDSPVGLCTAGEITKGGILDGTTQFTALSVAPSAGMPGAEPETTLAYSGLLTITTKQGTVVIRDVGVFDAARGVFGEVDRIVEGTGRFLGATGTLYVFGPTTADGTGFVGSIRGEVCLSR